jgi:hypothetical protein
MRRPLAFLIAATLVTATLALWPGRASAQKPQRVQLPEGTVLAPGTEPALSLDGSVGFVAPAVGDTVVAFAVRTGETVGELRGLGAASGLSLYENGERRMLVLTFPNDPQHGQPAVVAVVDATDLATLAVTATFVLPGTLELAPDARAVMARGQKIGVVPIVAPVPALISFDAETGQQVGALTLDGSPDRVTVAETGSGANVAVVSAQANEVAVLSIDESGVLLPVSTFAPPDGAPVSSANNVAFDAAGKTAYVASLRGRALFSFSVETGALVDRLATDGSSAAISVYHTADGERIAVSNVSRPGGLAEDDVAPKADEPPLGLPGAVVVEADASGKLSERARFYPETGDEVAPANNPAFSADGATLFVPARTGSLYVVDAVTGRARNRESLGPRVQAIAPAPLAEAVAVVSAGGSEGHIDIVPTAAAPLDEPKPDAEGASDPARDDAKKADRGDDREDAGSPPVIDRLTPATVQSGRRRDLAITVVGSGFAAGATVVVGDTQYSAEVGTKGKRANFTLSKDLLAAPATIPVQVRNPDGSVSNSVSLTVTSPFAPLIQQVHPAKIESGTDGVDLKIRGDHFRDDAVARVTYVDATGTTQTVELKTYRLSFASIVARLPKRLTQRAEDFDLTVVDRDGETASEAKQIQVVGPSIASVVPERFVAGDLDSGETLALHVTGANFHRDAVVYVKSPLRGDDTAATFRRVDSGAVRWKSDTKVIVKLGAGDVAYSGTLVVRVINPVPGEKRKNGDAADFDFAVAGPVIASTAPDVILAGSDAFVLKLTGTDFRRTATVKLQRDGAPEATRKIAVVDDPNFKNRKQINVQMNTPELLRLVAKPGTLNVRVINASIGKGDPSEAKQIQIVGPGILAYELIPAANDPTKYRLTLMGTYFAEGAVVQLYDANGNPVGEPVEARVKSPEELVALLGRGRVTELRTFKVVVINPGGPYNSDGVASNPVDVTVQ